MFLSSTNSQSASPDMLPLSRWESQALTVIPRGDFDLSCPECTINDKKDGNAVELNCKCKLADGNLNSTSIDLSECGP